MIARMVRHENKNPEKRQNYDNDSEPFSVKTLGDVYNLDKKQARQVKTAKYRFVAAHDNKL